MICVFVLAAITKHNKLDVLKNKHFFLTFQETGKSNIKVPANLVPGENLLPGSQMVVLAVSSYGGRDRELSVVCFMKILILYMRSLSHDLITSQGPHLQMPSHQGLSFSV